MHHELMKHQVTATFWSFLIVIIVNNNHDKSLEFPSFDFIKFSAMRWLVVMKNANTNADTQFMGQPVRQEYASTAHQLNLRSLFLLWWIYIEQN